MGTYATCECYGCYVRLPKPQAHRVTIERVKGRSGGSIRFNKKSTSYSTGRTYYAKQEVWLCDLCYAAHRKTQSVQGAISLAVFGAIALVCVWAFSGQSGTTATDRIPQAKSSSTTPTNQSAVANFVRIEEPRRQLPTPTIPKNNVTDVQTRRFQLGYFGGPADGVWGAKSRAALQAFKSANGLSSNETWDSTVSSRLFSNNAARAPLPIARAQ
jgi:Putative peptidoglycan binding domain